MLEIGIVYLAYMSGVGVVFILIAWGIEKHFDRRDRDRRWTSRGVYSHLKARPPSKR